MEEHLTHSLPQQEQDKKEIFARVWKRVMAENADSCPITWEENQEQTDLDGEDDKQMLLPAQKTAQKQHRPHGDFPQTSGVLGESCLECGPLLQELICRELTDCREYQALARRAGGTPGRVLAGLAGEKKRRAKKLSAAYFLISGIRYWPESEKLPPITSYLGTLRRRFAQEQATMAAYLTGTESTSDPCLQQLFWEHAREGWEQACRIRSLVENI